MNLIFDNNQLFWGNQTLLYSWGDEGIRILRQEGDGAAFVGTFPFRWIFYRADRLQKPETLLPLQSLTEREGWYDGVNNGRYNQHVILPYKGRYEKLWKKNHVYDLLQLPYRYSLRFLP